MRYAQIKSGQRMHMVYEPGEGPSRDTLTPAGQLSAPLCGQRADGYRMNCNLPLSNACRRCLRVYKARHG